jgi:vacuolar protein sorting-associated protein 35
VYCTVLHYLQSACSQHRYQCVIGELNLSQTLFDAIYISNQIKSNQIEINLFLPIYQAANECEYRGIAYEFMKDAFLLYESEITDSKTQVRSLTAIVGSLLNCRNFTEEDYEALITKAAQYANRLLKKPDQSRMITLCSHLFSPPAPSTPPPPAVGGGDLNVTPYSDPDRVLECLQRALKVASVSNPNIFVEILDRYVYTIILQSIDPLIYQRLLA